MMSGEGEAFFEDIYTFLTSFSLSSSTGGIILSGMLIICCENDLLLGWVGPLADTVELQVDKLNFKLQKLNLRPSW